MLANRRSCLAFVALALAGCASRKGAVDPGPEWGGPGLGRGLASWYGRGLHGRRTASGEPFDMNALTAAHRTLPLGTEVRVRSTRTGREVVVRINDRGPSKPERIIDLSQAAAVALGIKGLGVSEVELLRE